MEERLNRVKQQLQQSSYKLTPQREATVRVLIENEKDHLSAEDVYLKVKDKAPEIGLATVYRTLELLAEIKVLDKINFGDGVARFDLRKEGAKHFQHHLVCMECGKVEEIEDNPYAYILLGYNETTNHSFVEIDATIEVPRGFKNYDTDPVTIKLLTYIRKA